MQVSRKEYIARARCNADFVQMHYALHGADTKEAQDNLLKDMRELGYEITESGKSRCGYYFRPDGTCANCDTHIDSPQQRNDYKAYS